MIIIDIYSNTRFTFNNLLNIVSSSILNNDNIKYIQNFKHDIVNKEDYIFLSVSCLNDYKDDISKNLKKNIKLIVNKFYFNSNESDILKLLDEHFINYNFSFLSIDDYDFYLQNKVSFYLDNVKEEDDYTNLVFDVIDREGNEFKVIGNEIKKYHTYYGDVALIDKEYLVGHTHYFNLGIMFTCSCIMYYSKSYEMYLEVNKLRTYDKCYENVLIDKHTNRIRLFQDISAYNDEKNIELMKLFREELKIDYIAHLLLQLEYPVLSLDKLKNRINGIEILGRFLKRTFSYSSYELKKSDDFAKRIVNKVQLSKYRSKKYQKLVRSCVRLKNKYDLSNDSNSFNELLTKYYALDAVDLVLDSLKIELDFSLDSLIIIEQMIMYLERIKIDIQKQFNIDNKMGIYFALASYLAVVIVLSSNYKYKKSSDDNEVATIIYHKKEYDLKELVYFLVNDLPESDLFDYINDILTEIEK